MGRARRRPRQRLTDPTAFAAAVTQATGLPLSAIDSLFSGFTILNSRLNPRNAGARLPRKLRLLNGGSETILRWQTLLLRHIDRAFGARLSHYGWAFYFGPIAPDHALPQTNVCIRCGAAHPADWLAIHASIHGRPRRNACPKCGTTNFWTPDSRTSSSRTSRPPGARVAETRT
ncbi:MAG: hypothetical protein R2729_20655 [Bryobacteraceae bacterium]